MWIIKIIQIQCFLPTRILNEHWGIFSCLQIPPRENWFQYVRKVYSTPINFPCIIFLWTSKSAYFPLCRKIHILKLSKMNFDVFISSTCTIQIFKCLKIVFNSRSKWSIVKHSLIFIQRMKKKPVAR